MAIAQKIVKLCGECSTPICSCDPCAPPALKACPVYVTACETFQVTYELCGYVPDAGEDWKLQSKSLADGSILTHEATLEENDKITFDVIAPLDAGWYEMTPYVDATNGYTGPTCNLRIAECYSTVTTEEPCDCVPVEA